jgi:sec-independent protein translocase protein TatA
MLLIFNDIAGSEILLILVFVLIFFGSKSIPGLAKTLGRTIRQVKDASNDIQNEIKKSGEQMKGDLNLKEMIRDTAEEVRRPLDQSMDEIDNAVKYEAPKRNSTLKAREVEPSKVPIKEKEVEKDEDVESDKE